jgi:excisionase family DNA binding protein
MEDERRISELVIIRYVSGNTNRSGEYTVREERVFMNIEELADYLNEAKSTIYDWVQQGRIPYYKRGRRLQFHAEEIKEWDKENNYRPAMVKEAHLIL